MSLSYILVVFVFYAIPLLLSGDILASHRGAGPTTDIISQTDDVLLSKTKDNIVIRTKKINIDGFPRAFNPSLIKTDMGILLIFRNQPEFAERPFISETGAVWLNDSLEPISSPQLISTRKEGDPTPQQSEDARLFLLNGEIHLIYNDNIDETNPCGRRDMFIAKLEFNDGKFSVGQPLKLTHNDKYASTATQKNWEPFDWNGVLLLAYMINPHEILLPDLDSGVCFPAYTTEAHVDWHWGKLRGGSPAQHCGDHYLGFFHSPIQLQSETTQGREIMHYFMGAYTYSAEPPFNLTNLSPYPIFADNFFTQSSLGLRCIYPGGFFTSGNHIYLAYGKDDHEVWIATLDKDKLYRSLQPVETVASTQTIPEH